MDGSAGWSSSMTIVPARFLHYHASAQELREFYPAIKKWVCYNLESARTKCRPENEDLPKHVRDYILDCANNWGEWCEPGKTPVDYFRQSDLTGHADIATAFLAYDCYLSHEIAAALGEEADATFFYENYQKVKAAFRYVYTDNGRITSDRQCNYIRPVAHKLLDDREEQIAVDTLADMIKANGNRIGTGFLTTCHLGKTLTDHGHAATAYDLLLQRQQPSWLYEVGKGATTIWESWFGMREDGTPQGSHNHYSLGAIAGWMISHVLGITAYDGHIVIRPYPDERLGYAKGRYVSPFGEIASSWKYTERMIEFECDVPANANARIILPNGEEHAVGAGRHSFCMAR
jgi:alpha-L-rhamnosidase